MEWPLRQASPISLKMCEHSFARMETRLQRYVDEGFVAGVLTVQARHGEIAHTFCTGQLDIAQGTPLSFNSIFRMYSNTKLVCAVAVLQLYERGYVQLQDPVSKFIPEFEQLRVQVGDTMVDPHRAVTVHDLLVHIGGLSYDLVHQAKRESWSHDKFIEHFVQRPLISQPGVQWNYSASNDVLGILIERITGLGLDTYLKQEIFEPLNMWDTDFYVPFEKQNRFGPAYVYGDNGLSETTQLNADTFLEKPSFLSLGGGLVSTASDYLAFSQMLLNEGTFNDQRILSRKSVELMRADHLPIGHPDIDINKMRYGLSVEVLSDLGRTQRLGTIGEFGWGGAASTQVWIDPSEQKISLILMQLFGSKEPILNTFRTMSNAALL